MQTQELVTIIPWTFIAQILNLFIQMYLIKRFLFKPINAMLDKRKAMADAEIQQARREKNEAMTLKSSYENSLTQAKAEANSILQNAQKDAAARSEAIINDAQSQAANLKAKAEADILQEKKKAVNDIKNEIGGIAMEIAGKVVEREINEEDHKKLIDEFIENVGEAS
ncbi:F0F1 ATP synthase subunit B [Otoolea muris]|jgi:F-type H+-transporting ATPase subunit b|uniref:F0F1 ATP synthase subunit B n=1 Tax=Otoolea muris TaxID=2941515 RepID=UPI002040DCD7|nr:F0F1 ATP synthase subunit B [Otoolea muris]